jgi:hypothetical protein
MGSSVQADCSCGYHSGILMIGGGMANYTTLCAFPAWCPVCRELLLLNLLAGPLVCPHCASPQVLSYDDARLIGETGATQVVSWNVTDRLDRTLILTDGSYLCPNCGQFTLHFSSAGIQWD